jgi:hypothetical protein
MRRKNRDGDTKIRRKDRNPISGMDMRGPEFHESGGSASSLSCLRMRLFFAANQT